MDTDSIGIEVVGVRDGGVGVSVGRAAALLGVSPSTLRGWGRRYGLAPSRRSAGGHRRYTARDLDVLAWMRARVVDGLSPARAALLARSATVDDPVGVWAPGVGTGTGDVGGASGRGGPGGRVLAVPGGGREARGLARAASMLDVEAAATLVERVLVRDGVAHAWDGLLRPVLGAAGGHWARTGEGIEVEHLLTEATIEALRHHRRGLGLRRGREAAPTAGELAGSPVVLACAPGDLHSLPLHALAAALAETGVASRMLGPRVPGPALWATVRRLRGRAVFVWAQGPGAQVRGLLDEIPAMRPPVQVVVGGPGWDQVPLSPAWTRVGSLAEAAQLLGPRPIG